jgi:putative ABC transport system substrate-binding protein
MRALALGMLAFVPLLSALAQSPAPQPVVGVVFYNVPMRDLAGVVPESPFARALLDGLGEKGWQAGGNLRLVWTTSEGRHERIPALVEELIRKRVDVLVASGNDMAAETVKQSPRLPVVLASSDYPVENGLAQSLARPGGSVTGLTNWVDRSLDAKRLSLLKEMVPRATRIALMGPKGAGGFSKETLDAARNLGVELMKLGVDAASELAPAFDEARKRRADAILVVDYPFAFVRDNQLQIAAFAVKHSLPMMHSTSSAADAGALMSYAPDIYANFRRAGHYVDKILRGARPGDLPIEQPTNLELVLNLRAAKAIGLEVPPTLRTQATRVIP